MEDAAAEQSARLFRKIEYLSVIGNIAPMVGLLGTVVGLALTGWPGWLVVPLGLLAGFVGGGLWGAIPGALKGAARTLRHRLEAEFAKLDKHR